MLDVTDDERGLPLRLRLDVLDQLGLCVRRGQAGDPLELPLAVGLEVEQLGAAALECLLVLGQLAVAGLDPALLGVESLLAFGEALFAALEIVLDLVHPVLERASILAGGMDLASLLASGLPSTGARGR